MNKPEKLTMRTPDLSEEKFTVLASLFPNAVTETIDPNGKVVRAIDADVLTQEINSHVVSDKEERYQFTWPDKRKAILQANSPIAAALRPCREESVHFDSTENLYIEGDNLDVLKLLRETYLNRVKMIYIDPPYNTGNDFVYEDDFSEDSQSFLRRDGQYDQQGNRLTTNPDSNGRFHTDWLNMIYPRLRVARDLLTEDGVIFISIDDHEVANLRKVCDEIFGEVNFVAQVIWKKKYGSQNDAKWFSVSHDYIVVYAKYKEFWRPNLLPRTIEADNRYKNPDNDIRGSWKATDFSRPAIIQSCIYDIKLPSGRIIKTPKGRSWLKNKEGLDELISDNRIWFGENGDSVPSIKRFLSEVRDGMVCQTVWDYTEVGHTDKATKDLAQIIGGVFFDYPKPIELLKRIVYLATKPKDLILDFFSGSATTAHAVMQLNAEDEGKRKFIMVQVPEATSKDSEAAKAGYFNICEIGKERIRRAGQKVKQDSPITTQDLDIGFRVLKLDSSNMKDVYYTPDAIVQEGFDLEGFQDNIKPDRTGEDLLFQAMLELDIPLSAKIRQENGIFSVNDNYLIACFKQVDSAQITEIAKKQPYYAVFRDSSFASDSDFTNVEQLFKTYSPKTIRKVL
jgi:adenine-specific DNA-methyltransferase